MTVSMSVIVVVATFVCMSMGMAIFFAVIMRMSMVVRMFSMIVTMVMVAAWGLMKNPNEN